MQACGSRAIVCPLFFLFALLMLLVLPRSNAFHHRSSLGAISSRFLNKSLARNTLRMSFSSNAVPSASMLLPGKKNQVVLLAGATSVGKSKVAQLLCRDLGNCEVIVADSVQVYKHLDIGSNKPSQADQDEVPHHMVSLCEPSETYSCGDFVRSTVPIIYDILNRDKVPVIVGGSTMWLQWLVQGTPDAPKAEPHIIARVDDMLRPFDQEDKEGPDWSTAAAILEEHDPVRFKTLSRNDWYRLRRYLEVALSVQENSGDNSKTLENVRVPNLPGLDLRCFFLSEDREQLYRCIDARCEQMLHMGLVQEVAELVKSETLTPATSVSKAIGYRQTIDYMAKRIAMQEQQRVHGTELGLEVDLKTFGEYIEGFATATRNYAKRQLHWYRQDKEFLWLQINRGVVTAKSASGPLRGSGSGSESESESETEIGSEKEGAAGLGLDGDDMGDAPYHKVVTELKHWCDLPASNYRQMIKHQIQRGVAVKTLRQRKIKYDHNLRISSENEWLALAAMVGAGEIAAPQGGLVEFRGEHDIHGDIEMASIPSWGSTFESSLPPPPIDTGSAGRAGPGRRMGDGGAPTSSTSTVSMDEFEADTEDAGGIGLSQQGEGKEGGDAEEQALEAIAKAGAVGGFSGSRPRTMPGFPSADDLSSSVQWSADNALVRVPETHQGAKNRIIKEGKKGNCKGDKTSSWWRLRTYKNQVDEQQHAELEGVRLQADRMAQDVEGLYPGLLEGFFTESGKEGGKDEY